MSRQAEFVEFVLDRLTPMGEARARAMFGGYGIYDGATIFAIIVDDTLYFKADGVTLRAFTARGLKPFAYTARGKTVTTQYYEAPPEVFEEPEAMRSWAQQALQVALRAKKPPPKRAARRALGKVDRG
jgi:DNA transformation protein